MDKATILALTKPHGLFATPESFDVIQQLIDSCENPMVTLTAVMMYHNMLSKAIREAVADESQQYLLGYPYPLEGAAATS